MVVVGVGVAVVVVVVVAVVVVVVVAVAVAVGVVVAVVVVVVVVVAVVVGVVEIFYDRNQPGGVVAAGQCSEAGRLVILLRGLQRSSSVKQNRLDLKQKMALVEWLRANLESLSQEKASYSAAAARATKALGFVVTDKTCDSTCRQVGIKWDHALPNSARSYALQLASLEARIAAIEKALL